jgi:hypothetical protein
MIAVLIHLGGYQMDEAILTQLLDCFKTVYGAKLDSPETLFKMQQNLMEFVMGLGRKLENKVFAQAGTGYRGAIVEKDGNRYKFVGNRPTSVHGLFGMIRYQRGYYISEKKGEGSWIPLDEQLGIGKEHTPGLQYILSGFTAREVYQGSLDWFHQIFRPDGKDLVSMRKALDMDYELGTKLKERRRQEIAAGQKKRAVIEEQRPILGTVAVSIDAGKVREKLGQHVNAEGKKKYEIGFRDVKVAAVSEIFWDTNAEEAYCSNHSYVGAIEHAEEFFLRIWMEMRRRGANRPAKKCVFLADGANWIWDRVPDLAPAGSVMILDFFHACEHVSDLSKNLYGEGSEACEQRFRHWRAMLLAGAVDTFLAELKQLHEESGPGTKRADFLLGEIHYFTENRQRMRYDEYRAQRLPIGSGTIESCCKNVIAGRMKRGGMTWSPPGADGMVQIRCSLASKRFDIDFMGILAPAA